jgi:hypothetical protein
MLIRTGRAGRRARHHTGVREFPGTPRRLASGWTIATLAHPCPYLSRRNNGIGMTRLYVAKRDKAANEKTDPLIAHSANPHTPAACLNASVRVTFRRTENVRGRFGMAARGAMPDIRFHRLHARVNPDGAICYRASALTKSSALSSSVSGATPTRLRPAAFAM